MVTSIDDPHFESFAHAKLQSERVRLLCMLGFMTLFLTVGVYRIIQPADGGPMVGWVLLGAAIACFLYEWLMLQKVRRCIAISTDLSDTAWRLHVTIECCFPLIAIIGVRYAAPINPFTLLVSPAYPFIMILVSTAVLHLDRKLTLLTGIIGTLNYTLAIAFVFATRDVAHTNPHPTAMYVTLAIVLAMATVASAFVTDRVRNYVDLAVRELELRRQKDRLDRDIAMAREIQQGLLPNETPQLAGYDIAAHSEPADQTGGDYYDWQVIDEHRIVISLADVTGHGIGPALVTAACRAYVRATLTGDIAPSNVITRVNELLHDDLPAGRFVTFALIELNTRTHTARLMAAGHGPTFFIQHNGDEVQTLLPQGMPMGIDLNLGLDEPIEIAMQPGDAMVMLTDGFFEWSDLNGKQFGIDRLRQVMHNSREHAADAIIAKMDQAIRRFTNRPDQDDDMTAVVIRRLPTNAAPELQT